ncbi:uncharacterized protein LOC126921274, partial [Bombus affinis]|uniref:uncharacterized protein LOC126921274 n=1 Tax=Bombus affinis TaxID=309941 RepID=UPI0021B78BDC
TERPKAETTWKDGTRGEWQGRQIIRSTNNSMVTRSKGLRCGSKTYTGWMQYFLLASVGLFQGRFRCSTRFQPRF